MKIICNTVQNRIPRTSKNVKGDGHLTDTKEKKRYNRTYS